MKARTRLENVGVVNVSCLSRGREGEEEVKGGPEGERWKGEKVERLKRVKGSVCGNYRAG